MHCAWALGSTAVHSPRVNWWPSGARAGKPNRESQRSVESGVAAVIMLAPGPRTNVVTGSPVLRRGASAWVVFRPMAAKTAKAKRIDFVIIIFSGYDLRRRLQVQ